MSKKAAAGTSKGKTTAVAPRAGATSTARERARAEGETSSSESIDPPADDPTLGKKLHPAELAKPGESTREDVENDQDGEGRPTAREGLRPIANEKPHPTAAARVGKTVGSIQGIGAAATLDQVAPVKSGKTMRVQATKLGYYDHTRRRVGDVFDISSDTDDKGNVIDFSRNWMVPVDRSVRTNVTTSAQALAREQNDLKLLKGQGQKTAGDPLGADN